MTQAATAVTTAVLAELAPGERRVAVTPTDLRRLAAKTTFLIEAGAGAAAGFDDQAYADAGAEILDRAAALDRADLVLAVRAPESVDAFRPGTVLISLGARDTDFAKAAMSKGIIHLGLERLPRITRAQSMDVLSSQASVAGYAAVIEAARMLDILLPMMTTAAGIIKPAKMIALGAGVAGLQAIATARRLGAVTHGFDVREAAREQVESLGARFVFPEVSLPTAEGAGGYAGEQSKDQQAALRRELTPVLAEMQLVVTSAQIPGRRAPLLIDDETLAAMAPGAVIIDLAAETGGNASRTRPDEVVTVGGVRLLGPTNLPSLMATDSSRLFSGNMRALLEHLLPKEGPLELRSEDEITKALLGDRVPAAAAA
jgi:NAD(P) transhydrogenase subunit alpha